MLSVALEKVVVLSDMRRKKNILQRADEWMLNSLVAACVAKDYDEFVRIRVSRREIPASDRISKEYFHFLVGVVEGLKGPRTFTKHEFDDWFSCTCLPSGTKGTRHVHLRIPTMNHKTLKEFGEVVWMWVCLIRSKYLSVHWRWVCFYEYLCRVFHQLMNNVWLFFICSPYRGYLIKAKRRLIDSQPIRDLQGLRRILGATVVVGKRTRNSGKFKFADAPKVERSSVVAYVCGPIGLLNGACWEHANCESEDYKEARVMKLHTIEKDEELTFCYSKDEAVDIAGVDRQVHCGFRGCRKVILKWKSMQCVWNWRSSIK